MSQPPVFITGAAKRLGAAIALYFANRGHDIALHYHTAEVEAKELAGRIEQTGVRVALFQQDISALPALPALVEKVLTAFPACGVLINNASIFQQCTFMDSDAALYERQLTINSTAPILLTQAFVKQATAPSLSVVNMLDTAVVRKHSTHFMYLLSKKNLAVFTEMAAYELGSRARINGICPGPVLPAINTGDTSYMESIEDRLPLHTPATVEAVCHMVYFAAMEATSTTGQLWHVDGGEHLL